MLNVLGIVGADINEKTQIVNVVDKNRMLGLDYNGEGLSCLLQYVEDKKQNKSKRKQDFLKK